MLAFVHALITSFDHGQCLRVQEEFADYQQNICNPQLCFLRPLEILLARKSQSSKLHLPSPGKLQVFGGHYRQVNNTIIPSRKPFWFALFSKLLGSHYLSTTTWRTFIQGGDKSKIQIIFLVEVHLAFKLVYRHSILKQT